MAGKKERLDVEQDLGFERKQWAVERAGWGLMAAIVAAGLLGAFGHGPASWSVAREGRLAVAHDRFGRFAGETQLRVTVEPIGGDRVEVSLGHAFLEAMEVSAVTPEASDIRLARDSIVYAFPIAEETKAVTIVFQLRPEALGTVEGRVGLEGGDEVRFTQFIYP